MFEYDNSFSYTRYKEIVFDTPIPAGTYTVSIGKIETSGSNSYTTIQFYWEQEGSAHYTKSFNIGENASETIVFEKDITKIRCYAYYDYGSSSGITITFTNIQIEAGSTPSDYIEHAEQNFTLNLGSLELANISTYKDFIFHNVPSSPYYDSSLVNGNWYKKACVGKTILDGSNDESWNIEYSGTEHYFYRYVSISDGISFYPHSLCNYFINVEISSDNTTQGFFIRESNKHLRVRYGTEMTLANWKTWLSSHNLVLYYPLATPTNTEITDATLINQLNTIEEANGYTGTTYITVTNSNNLAIVPSYKYNFVTPAPSPERPSAVEVVTGENTITIANSDNSQSQTYTISLGSQEYCKIGNNEDYIYRQNGNWYKKGYIGKLVLNGTQTFTYTSVTQGSLFRYTDLQDSIYNNYYTPLSTHYIGIPATDYQNRQNNQFYINAYAPTSRYLDVIDNRFTNATDFMNWLYSNNVTIYYILATATDTQITDTVLVNQLEDIYNKAKTYQGVTHITQTNAKQPFILELDYKKSNLLRIQALEDA